MNKKPKTAFQVKTEIVHRKIDNKYMVYGYIPDPNFSWKEYSKNPIVTYTPYRWVILGVFDEKATAEKQRKTLQFNYRKPKQAPAKVA